MIIIVIIHIIIILLCKNLKTNVVMLHKNALFSPLLFCFFVYFVRLSFCQFGHCLNTPLQHQQENSRFD